MLIAFQGLTMPAAFCFATGVYAAGSIPALLVGTVPPQWLVHAGHTLNRAIAATDHYLVPHTAAIWHALFTARETGRDAAALLLMLTPIPTGDNR